MKDGEVLFAKGYGKADLRDDEPVVADETFFPMASVSKLFTGTAVMQLVEEGRVDLDEDVNADLDGVEVPNTYPGEPVTLRHLLTHTAGFEDRFTGSVAVVAYEKLLFYESPGLHRGLLGGNLAVFLLTALAWPVAAIISPWYHKRHGNRAERPDRIGGTPRQARLLAWAVCVLDLLFVVGMAMAVSSDEVMAQGVSPLLLGVLSVLLLSLALTAGVLVYAALVWSRGYWGLFGRLQYSLVALSALVFVALLGYYNLIGFQF